MLEPGVEGVPVDAEAIAHRIDGDEIDLIELGSRRGFVQARERVHGEIVER